ncbi:MAG TPA: TIGR01777 family oxidoreductase [Streptosporangiaceae bacterium]|nr:TIGR01777 family oxidoreductase [Streptosporangiaceae bacterium]
MKVVLAGGSGALGRRIAADLTARGDEVVVLSRSPATEPADGRQAGGKVRQLHWDGVHAGPWATELAGAVLVNLAGELVDRRPTPANIEVLTRSRVEPTRALRQAVAGLATPPAAWIQMSTLAIYGDAGDAVLDETAATADGPAQMAGVARAWETAAKGAIAGRQVVLRTAVVLDRGTPAYARLSALTRWGIGGRIGTGRQWVSWLHIDDFLGIVRLCLDDAGLAGVIHATSPEPVTNAEFMAAFRHAWGRPAAPPTPAWLLTFGAMLLRTDPALALTGRRCVPARLTALGFGFKYPRIGAAVADLRGAALSCRSRPSAGWLA